MLENDYILEIKDLVKDYSGVRAVDGISLGLQRGRILALLGPNGSGKSTILKSAAGLVKPASGEIRICGLLPGNETKKLVSYLPENDCIYPWMTVKQAVGFVSSFYCDWDNAKCRELTDYLKLDGFSVIRKLSKGMRAKLKILLALSRNCPLMLLDEPLSGVDLPARSKIIEAVVSQYRSHEQSIILSTHEVAEAEGIFDEVVFLEKGRVTLSGQADELRDRYNASVADLLLEVYQA